MPWLLTPRSWIFLPAALHRFTPQTLSCPLIASGVVPVLVGAGVGDAEVVVALGLGEAGAAVGVLLLGTVAEGIALVSPVQAWPLTVHAVGRPVPLTTKPKLVEAPPAIEAFQPAGVKVMVWPETAGVVFHDWAIVDPAGSVSSTFQVPIVDEEPLLTVISP
ncbi:hypothetical protein GCM10010168_31300 [Actinoplanes ianthinogenes]|uniref:Uncharacterized protein n=1 Tax=Actinoplanes ianthinogenes TaxID=122358 RepID=A0ABM7LM36_9ACTN|nr:hypothetical protein Aiant_09290 [Actinoplanes ianthinogenes]GGR11296.1 hypothetical protein GCM10010168_31300 [Actinoplanes ianthinogenes]